jgi:hypothetical protein
MLSGHTCRKFLGDKNSPARGEVSGLRSVMGVSIVGFQFKTMAKLLGGLFVRLAL